MLKAIGNKVIVEIELLGEAHTRKSGILIKQTKGGVPVSGRVFSIGDEVPTDVEYTIGDRVIFNEARPLGFHHEGKKLLDLSPDQILATVPEGVQVTPGGDA